MVEVVLRARDKEPARCPYCRSSVEPVAASWACPECATLHHRGCARENHGCTLLGCAGKLPPLPARRSVEVAAPRPQRSISARRRAAQALGFLLATGALVLFAALAEPVLRQGTEPLISFAVLCGTVGVIGLHDFLFARSDPLVATIAEALLGERPPVRSRRSRPT